MDGFDLEKAIYIVDAGNPDAVGKGSKVSDFKTISFIKNRQSASTYDFTDADVPLNTTIYYRLKIRDADGSSVYSKTVAVQTGNGKLQMHFAPNPFAEQTTLSIHLPTDTDVNIRLFDIAGREVRRLNLGQLAEGQHEIVVRRNDLPSGTYFCRLQTSRETVVLSLMIGF